MNIYLIISFVFVSSFLFTFTLLYLYSKAKDPLRRRLGDLQNNAEYLKQKSNSSLKRNLSLWGENPHKSSNTKLWLVKAGYRKPQSVSNYHGSRLLCLLFLTISSALLGFILHFDSTELAASVALGVLVGANIPKIWVMHKINKRREEIRRAIPNVLDLMVVCAEAGLSFTAAIQRIVKENRTSRNPLYEELQLLTQEFLIGGSKADAFRNLANRTGVEEIRSLAITLIQAEKLGTSIAESLRVLADSMRFKRRQRAEEQANKTSVKLVFPLVLLIFPELLVILVGPALIIMYNTLSQVAQ
jgi:tight adherence protein C